MKQLSVCTGFVTQRRPWGPRSSPREAKGPGAPETSGCVDPCSHITDPRSRQLQGRMPGKAPPGCTACACSLCCDTAGGRGVHGGQLFYKVTHPIL